MQEEEKQEEKEVNPEEVFNEAMEEADLEPADIQPRDDDPEEKPVEQVEPASPEQLDLFSNSQGVKRVEKKMRKGKKITRQEAFQAMVELKDAVRQLDGRLQYIGAVMQMLDDGVMKTHSNITIVAAVLEDKGLITQEECEKKYNELKAKEEEAKEKAEQEAKEGHPECHYCGKDECEFCNPPDLEGDKPITCSPSDPCETTCSPSDPCETGCKNCSEELAPTEE